MGPVTARLTVLVEFSGHSIGKENPFEAWGDGVEATELSILGEPDS